MARIEDELGGIPGGIRCSKCSTTTNVTINFCTASQALVGVLMKRPSISVVIISDNVSKNILLNDYAIYVMGYVGISQTCCEPLA